MPRTLSSHLFAGAALAALTMASAEASAQVAGRTADRLILAPNPEDGFATMRPVMHDRTRFFGSLTADYLRRPFRMSAVTNNGAVTRAYGGVINNQANLNATIGGEFLQRFSLSVTLPVTIVNTAPEGDNGNISQAKLFGLDPGAGIGDLRLDGRILIARTDSGNFRLGVAGTYFIGSGSQSSFTGDGSGHTLLQVLLQERVGKLEINEFVGFHWRPGHDIGQDGEAGLHIGNELVFGASAFYPLRDGRVRIGGEVYGSTGVGKASTQVGNEEVQTFLKKKTTPIEWLGEVRFGLGERQQTWLNFGAGTLISPGYSAPDLRVIAQVGYWFEIRDTAPTSPTPKIRTEERVEEKASDIDGDGIPDAIDACPTVPEDHLPPNPNDGCPGPKDRDGDGIPDDKDKCPDQPEDRDGFEDDDGCPDPDNDKDGIPDVQDACPREPGQPSPDPKQNGCPQFIRRIEGSNEIQILKKIEFDTGKATIKKGSYPILDEIVKLLAANPGIKKISIEGHTDSRGAHDMNSKLSKDRAASCRQYLVDHGVDPSRLTSEGFGPDKPIEDNATDAGRQKNRRVEFHIVEQELPPSGRVRGPRRGGAALVVFGASGARPHPPAPSPCAAGRGGDRGVVGAGWSSLHSRRFPLRLPSPCGAGGGAGGWGPRPRVIQLKRG